MSQLLFVPSVGLTTVHTVTAQTVPALQVGINFLIGFYSAVAVIIFFHRRDQLAATMAALVTAAEGLPCSVQLTLTIKSPRPTGRSCSQTARGDPRGQGGYLE